MRWEKRETATGRSPFFLDYEVTETLLFRLAKHDVIATPAMNIAYVSGSGTGETAYAVPEAPMALASSNSAPLEEKPMTRESSTV